MAQLGTQYDLLAAAVLERNGYRVRFDADTSLSMSEDGYRQILMHSQILERWSDCLAALDPLIGDVCREHGRSIDDLRWEVNDIAHPVTDPNRVTLWLNGWHDRAALVFCVAAWAETFPTGLLVEVPHVE